MLRNAVKIIAPLLVAALFFRQIAAGDSSIVKSLAPIPNVKLTRIAPKYTAFKFNIKKPARHYQTLIRQNNPKGTNHRSVAAILGAHQRVTGGGGYENITSTTAYGTQYGIEILWQDMPVTMLFDTGSSDTWIPMGNFTCKGPFGDTYPQEDCAFGQTYSRGFEKYGMVVPKEHLHIRYGDGEVVTGPMGYIDIGVQNMTVKKQQVALVDNAYWTGNNVTSGVLGLAFPSLTSAFSGEENGDSPSVLDQIVYNPIFTNMVNQGICPPVFSMVIKRNASNGMISFGGTVPVHDVDYSIQAETDLLIVSSNATKHPP
jgi:hypothetical protein